MHQHTSGALEVGGKTIAVLGCGVDYIYPPENEQIYNQIIKSGGAIISEYPEGTPPDSEKFRQRNRIVSGLGLGVLIIEAEQRSGTSITARYAKEQGKNVFCIPNAIENRKGVGTNNLIKKGAKLILTPEEIYNEYGNITKAKQLSIEDLERKVAKININDIKEEYREIYKALQKEPLSINEISLKTEIDVTELYSRTILMEIEDLIVRNGNKYEIKGRNK